MLNLYKINPDYLKFMHRLDYRINVKNNRPFVGILTVVNGIRYVLPLTSQTTSVRRAMGKEKRAYNRIMKRNPFLLKACCDFQKLENSYLDFEFPSENTADGEAPCS